MPGNISLKNEYLLYEARGEINIPDELKKITDAAQQYYSGQKRNLIIVDYESQFDASVADLYYIAKIILTLHKYLYKKIYVVPYGQRQTGLANMFARYASLIGLEVEVEESLIDVEKNIKKLKNQ